jgi:hypothetical protein
MGDADICRFFMRCPPRIRKSFPSKSFPKGVVVKAPAAESWWWLKTLVLNVSFEMTGKNARTAIILPKPE